MKGLAPVELIAYAARHLGDLCPEVTFLGGAVVGLLITDRAARPPRATNDVDVVVEIARTMDYHALEGRLRARGFANDMRGPICRFLHGGIMIDVMPTDPGVLGFSNRWYPLAVQTARPYTLESGITINLITPACFLATKLEAFDDPHRENHGDIFTSRDFEDIVRVVDGRPSVVDDVLAAPDALREYLQERIPRLLEESYFEASLDHFEEGRAAVVIERLSAIAPP